MKNKYIGLHSNCVVVKGVSKSIILDLQRSKIFKIHNEICDLFLQNRIIMESAFRKALDLTVDKSDFIIKELELNDLVFFTTEPSRFPDISFDWFHPSKVTNSIIEYSPVVQRNWQVIIKSFLKLGVEYLELRFYDSVGQSELLTILNSFRETKIKSIYLILPDSHFDLDRILLKHQRIARIVLTSFKGLSSASPDFAFSDRIVYVNAEFSSNKLCGSIHTSYFVANYQSFSEMRSFNGCLNRKISIDKTGEIKNCPSMIVSYGNIDEVSLEDAIDVPGFKKYWKISKDDINGCRDCEFRYICTDCRAYVEDPNDISGPNQTNLSKPLKCGYDPYSGQWSEWSTNPLKQKSIEFYNMDDFV